MRKLLKKITSAQIIAIGFALAIACGTILLLLPFSTKSGECAGFMNSFFTATSAICVTGLTVQDTATYWSVFGQIVILILIQIGGLGVVSFATLISILTKRRIGLLTRSTLQETISAPNIGGIVKLTKFAIVFTIIAESVGFFCMLPVFCKEFGAIGIWYSLFHSISAFCNAGFDIVGAGFSSLTQYVANPLLNITIVILIIVGGIGFTTIDDIRKNKFHLGRYSLQSKIVLLTTSLLIILPTLYFFFFEFADMPLKSRFLASLFQSVTTRTAGFNTVNLSTMSDTGLSIMIFLMLVGGSPGSTAGGIKTTTLVVLLLTALSVFKRNEDATCFKRRLSDKTIKNAIAICCLCVGLFLIGGMIISRVENLPLLTTLFETASAVGTVGLSLGITASLSILSKLILILLMYLGRIGALTLVFATFTIKKNNLSRLPEDKVTVG